MYYHGSWTQWSLGRVTHGDINICGVKGHLRIIYGYWPFGLSFWKMVSNVFSWDLGRLAQITLTGMGSNLIIITMIAEVCHRKIRWDSWFENHLVLSDVNIGSLIRHRCHQTTTNWCTYQDSAGHLVALLFHISSIALCTNYVRKMDFCPSVKG